MNRSIHIIAEAGTNHNGQIEKAKELVDIAVKSKSDSVKFQIIYPEGLYLPGEYEFGHYDIKEVIRIRKNSILSDYEYQTLADYCKQQKITFSASVFDKKGLELLVKYYPPYIKIASCDLNNIRFLRQVAEKGIKMIISTGMSSLMDIEKSIKEIKKTGFNDIVLMHCVSVYPSSLQQTNLSFIDTLKNNFGYPVGFSDHTQTSIAACLALTKGVSWIEKHFTTDKTQEGFDHLYALEAKEMIQYIEDIDNSLNALRIQDQKISDQERYTRKRARRSVYAARDLIAGEIVRDEDVLVVRPEGIMNADDIDFVIGKSMKTAITIYQPFSKDILQ